MRIDVVPGDLALDRLQRRCPLPQHLQRLVDARLLDDDRLYGHAHGLVVAQLDGRAHRDRRLHDQRLGRLDDQPRPGNGVDALVGFQRLAVDVRAPAHRAPRPAPAPRRSSCSTMFLGALPGRKPGTFAFGASLRSAFSRAASSRSGSTSMVIRIWDSGIFSVETFKRLPTSPTGLRPSCTRQTAAVAAVRRSAGIRRTIEV